MSRFVAGFVGLSLTLAGCAIRRSPLASADPQTLTDLQTAYVCAQNTLAAAGYRVTKNDRELKLRGWIGDDGVVPPSLVGIAAASDGPPSPYEVDGVDAVVSLDKQGQVRVAAKAFTGVGASAMSGYTIRGASGRGAAAATKIENCASALVLPPA
jgi:hypothetical protein